MAVAGEGAEESGVCPLAKNGRLSECTALAEKIFRYTDQQLYHACKQAELQAWPQCLKGIIEECQDLGYGDPGQILQLHNATLLWQAKFEQMCATVLELHQSKGTASFVSTSSSQWHAATWLPPLALLLLLGFCLRTV
ncbi:hypothetical protein ACOMHN_030900 [Nucella lapillus]